MSEKIHQLIDQIRADYKRLDDQFLEQKSKVSELQDEANSLHSKLNERENTIAALELKVNELESAKNEVSEQVIASSEGTMLSEEQIDELVKEIDYCIGQLKE